MATFAQLEIIGPGGSVEFHSLDRPQGVANIGRHPDNDIVIDSPSIAPFHAVVDYRQWPCQVILLSEEGQTTLEGQQLAANSPTAMDNWNTIRVDGYDIILLHAGADAVGVPLPQPAAPVAAPTGFDQPMTVISAGPMPVPAALPPVPAAPAPMSFGFPGEPSAIGPEQTDEYIATELTEDAWELDVEQTASTQLTIINGGDRVASFYVSVEGVSADWVYIESQQVNLIEGDRAIISIHITPPRAPTSLAGQHPVAFVVTSPTYPGHFARNVGTLTLNPYYEFSVGEMSPKVLGLSWSRPEGAVTVPIKNLGNSSTQFVLDAADDERACSFEFEVPGEETVLAMRAGITLPPGGSQAVPVVVTPPRRVLALRRRTHSFTITTSLLQGEQTPRSLMGRATMRPLFGLLHIALFTIAVVALTIFFFMPHPSPTLQGSVDRTDSYMQEITLSYNAYRFPERKPGNLFNWLNAAALKGTIEYRPDSEIEWQLLHTTDIPSGTIPHVPTANGRYRVRTDTWVSKILPMLQGETERLVKVPPIPPEITEFETDRTTIDIGETVSVTWVITNAETVLLDLGQGLESIKETTGGQARVSLEESTIFLIEAENIFGKVSKPARVNVNPTPTPPPPPEINAFSAKPDQLTRGDPGQITTLSWNVTTYTLDTEIAIGVLGAPPFRTGLSASGSFTVPVADTTVFMLSASQGEKVDTSQAMVTLLDPTPTPTPPPPKKPEIDLFSGTPNEVVAGDSQVVKLQWRVVGETTNIEITAPNLKLSGLEAQDEKGLDVTVNETTLFVLTAFNEDQSSSQPLEIKAIDPTPTPTPVPPPPHIHFFTAQAVGNPRDVTQQSTTTRPDGTTIVYSVVAGTEVRLDWLVEDHDALILTGPGINEGVAQQGPKPIGTVTTDSTYQLVASNDGGTTTDIVILRVTLKPPPAPHNVDGDADYVGNVITITWDYDQASFDKVYFIGFKIYSADVSPGSSGNFSEVGQVLKGTDPIPPYLYVHTIASPGIAYGRAYYVTAVYQDVIQGVTKETEASRNSWYSDPRPVP